MFINLNELPYDEFDEAENYEDLEEFGDDAEIADPTPDFD